MNHATDDGYASAVIETVRALTKQVEASEQRVEQVVNELRKDVESVVTAVRKDVNLTTAAIYVRLASHDRQHAIDRLRTNIAQGLLALLVVINIGLISYLIGRGT